MVLCDQFRCEGNNAADKDGKLTLILTTSSAVLSKTLSKSVLQIITKNCKNLLKYTIDTFTYFFSQPTNKNHKRKIVVNFLLGRVCEFGKLPIVFLLEKSLKFVRICCRSNSSYLDESNWLPEQCWALSSYPHGQTWSEICKNDSTLWRSWHMFWKDSLLSLHI